MTSEIGDYVVLRGTDGRHGRVVPNLEGPVDFVAVLMDDTGYRVFVHPDDLY